MADEKKVYENISDWLSSILCDERGGGVYRLVRESGTQFAVYRVSRDVILVFQLIFSNSVMGDGFVAVWNSIKTAGPFKITHPSQSEIKLSMELEVS